MFCKKNDVKNILQPIPSRNFVLNVDSKCCKIFKQISCRHFLKSYVVSDVSKSKKNRNMLLVCFIKNNNVKNILQLIPSHNFVIDV